MVRRQWADIPMGKDHYLEFLPIEEVQGITRRRGVAIALNS
jgi:hypothetical protein